MACERQVVREGPLCISLACWETCQWAFGLVEPWIILGMFQGRLQAEVMR